MACCLISSLTAPVLLDEPDPSVGGLPRIVVWVALVGAVVGIAAVGASRSSSLGSPHTSPVMVPSSSVEPTSWSLDDAVLVTPTGPGVSRAAVAV